MLQTYATNEFYADALSHQLISAKRWCDKVALGIMAGAFSIGLVMLFWRKEEMNKYMNEWTNAFVQWLFANGYARMLLLGIAGLPLLVNVGPTILYNVRKYWLFPKSSMQLQSHLKVHSKESVDLPRTKNSTKTSKAFYVRVGHPMTGKALPVEISEDWYHELNAGSQVYARYHPTSENVLYLVKN